jgi:ABC-type glycerol-3-phosphate transport system substrate-binding protein
MQIVQDYEKLHPDIKIEVQRVPFSGMETKILTALAAHMAPDIARVDYAFVAHLASKKAAVPILPDELEPVVDELLRAPLLSDMIHDTLYGVPDQTTCILLFYNKDLFSKYGVSGPPKTWDEFVKVARKLTHPSQGIYGFAMRNSLWWTFPFFFSFGAKFLSPDLKTCLLDSKEAIEAFSFKVDLYRKYKVEAGAWKPGAINPDMGFRNGKYAMILSGPWAIKSLEQSGLNFGVAPIPSGPAGSKTAIGGTNMVILNPEKKKIAIDFLKFLVSQKEQAKWANALGQVPVNRKAFLLVDTLSHPYLKTIMKALDNAEPRPPIPMYSQIETVVNGEMALALEGKKTPEQALKDACKRVNGILKGLE